MTGIVCGVALVLSSASVAASSASASIPGDTTLALADSTRPDSLAADSISTPPATVSEPGESPSLVDRAKHGTINLLSDTWWVFSSPARLNRRSAIGTAVVLGATAVLYQYDDEIFEATQRNKDEQPFKALMDFTDSYVEIGFMPNAFKVEAGVAVVGYVFKSEPLRQIPIELIESHIIAGTLRNILKPIVGRAHPYENLGPHHFEFNNGTSFPSGHTSVLFEIATVVAEHVHSAPVTAALYAAATLGAVQRIESQNHWPTDVFIPSITGSLIAHTVVRRNAERRARDASSESGWTPMLDVVPGGLRVGVSRGF
jgi:hypothetical protein